jgi:hypothetical protein
MGSPNALAWLALALWPVACLVAFRMLGPSRGLIVSLLGGYLLLPPGAAYFDPPLLPELNKDTIPGFSVMAIALLLYRPSLRLLPGNRVVRLLLAGYFAGQVLTVLTNTDPVFWGTFSRPGMAPKEALRNLLALIATVAPFLLGRAFLSREEDLRDLLWALVIATFLYSFPMLLEVRLSPQLNTWIYGYFQHSFAQMMRGDGFRPLVFLYHGLWAAFLVATAVLAACTLLREGRRPILLALAAIWLMGVLILCKSMAALIYALASVALILFASLRTQARLAALTAVLVLAYPILRGADLVPVDTMVDLAERYSAQRAQSLEFRFDNEGVLLDRARERPLFGWGGWGRNLEYEDDTGIQRGFPDGRWIITLSALGWTGYLTEFGLLVLPILLVWWQSGSRPSRVASGAAFILAINLVDLIPNGTLTPLTWLFAGALLGWAEQPRTAEAPDPGLARSPLPVIPVQLGAVREGGLRTLL